VAVASIAAVAVLLVVVVVVVGEVLRGDSDVDIPERAVPSEGRTLGYEDAPLTIVEYSDFQCPFCARAAGTTTPLIEEEYVASGQVKFMHHYMAFEGPASVLAAEAAECANDQGRFWEYRDTLFENQIVFSAEDLRGFAEGLGLDMATFNQCLDSGEHEQLVTEETREALDAGIHSTPTFIIGDQALIGAQPIEAFRQMIEAELSKNQ
jgi:protein-disulfide isomerase